MKKKICSLILCMIMILSLSSQAFANDRTDDYTNRSPNRDENITLTEETTSEKEKGEERLGDFVIVYGYDYTPSSLKSGSWRNGVSGGSDVSASTLTFNYNYNYSYNISFTATVSGSYTNGGTIGTALGVTLGASQAYSLGSGYSVVVPQGSHYMIRYRPQYYTYTVVETKYMERYNEFLGGWERYVLEVKTCYVDVFSHWDFTHIAV